MVDIRDARIDDVAELHELGREVSEFTVNRETVTFWPEAILRDAIVSNGVFIVIAEDDHKLVGFVIASFSIGLKKATIENIFVTQTYRGQKIGERLLAALIDKLTQHGCEYVATLIPSDADGARSVYEASGFMAGETFTWFDMPLVNRYTK